MGHSFLVIMKPYHIILGGIGLVVVSAAGIILLATKGGSALRQSAALVDAVADYDWASGPRTAPVTLVEYSDFQCPACGAYYPVLKELMKEYDGRIRFVYRHFPLRAIHAHADFAARAAEAAGKQGKFWEMEALLFEHQRDWAESANAEGLITEYAVSLGLDRGRFESDVNSREVSQKVEKDFQGGLASGVNATPTFFLNGKKLENPKSYDEFRNTITAELEKEQ